MDEPGLDLTVAAVDGLTLARCRSVDPLTAERAHLALVRLHDALAHPAGGQGAEARPGA